MKVNIYDFDGTIYDGDSSVDFYKYCLKRKITIIKYLPSFILFAFLYKANFVTKEKMKEKFFAFLKEFSNISEIVSGFWKEHKYKIKEFYCKTNHKQDIIISASPYFLLKYICNSLEVKDLIASNVDKKSGKYNGKNCYGKEKVILLKDKYPNVIIDKVYTDSLSDKPLLELAQSGFIVKKNNIYKYQRK